MFSADKCRKCGSRSVSTSYDGSLDILRRGCCNCGFAWTSAPLDRKASKLDALEELKRRAGSAEAPPE